MEPIANCKHAIPKPYWFQYEKCEKKSWELQAYTYTAFVAPLQLSRWSFTSRPRLTLGEIKKIINYCKNDYKNAMLYESPHDKRSVNTEKLSENRSITTTTVTNIVHCYESPHCKCSYYTADTNYSNCDIAGRVSIPVMTFNVTILHSSKPALIHYLNDWWVICN